MKMNAADWKTHWKLDLLVVAGLVLATAAVYYLGVQPLVANASQFEQRSDELVVHERQASAASKLVETKQQVLADVQAEVAALPLKLRPIEDMNTRLAELTAMLNELGLRIDRISSQTPEAGRYYTKAPIVVTGDGRLGQCLRLLEQLHRQVRDMSVVSVEMQRALEQPTALEATAGATSGTERADATADSDAAARFHVKLYWYAAPVEKK